MIRGVTVSALVHASVLAVAVISWPPADFDCDRQIDQLRRERPGISAVEIVMQLPQCAASSDLPIDFVEIARLSDVAPMRRNETVRPPEPERPPEPPPPPVEAKPAPAPPPQQPDRVVPDPRRPDKPPERAAPEKKPEPPRAPAAPPERTPAPEPDDLSFLSDFEDTLRSKKPAAQPDPADPSEGDETQGDRDRRGAGERRGNTASLQAAMRAQIEPCWVPVSDLPPEHQIIVTVRVMLDRDGTIIGAPELVRPSARPVGRSGIAVDRALRAVRKCAAYRLPADDYEEWKQIDVAIGPER